MNENIIIQIDKQCLPCGIKLDPKNNKIAIKKFNLHREVDDVTEITITFDVSKIVYEND